MQDEFRLQLHRPAELPPIPPMDENELEEESPAPVQDGGVRGSRSPKRGRNMGSGNGKSRNPSRVKTPPSSWGTPAMVSGGRPVGFTQKVEAAGGGERDDLAEQLGEAVVRELASENAKLREELMALKMGKGSGSRSSWSEVSGGSGVKMTEGKMLLSSEPLRTEGVMPTSPVKEIEVKDNRHTPGGTKVPDGPPPLDEGLVEAVPPPPSWIVAEWDMYQREEHTRRQWIGDRPWSPVTLRRTVVGREDRGWDVPNPDQARLMWLEPELRSLQVAMETSREPALREGYWRQSVHRWPRVDGECVAWNGPEEPHQARASTPEVPHQVRASIPEESHQVRASILEESHQVRASTLEEPHQVRASIPEVLHQVRASTSEELHQDRAEHEGVCHQARAQHGGDYGGNRALHGSGVLHDTGGQGQGLLGGQDEGQVRQGRDLGMPQFGGQQMAGDGHGSGGRVELPALPERLNPMELGDWLCLISPIMRDISVNSSLWWKLTMESAQAYYDEWRHSTPVQRVRINPTLPPELCTPQFIRTEQRGMGLLLRSLTEEIRKVVLANRDLTSTHIIWRLLITYQPGGSGEKGQLLSTLTTMPSVTSAGDLATLIRHWRRSFQRAQEIGTSLPDGTLLIKSLEQATKYLGQLDSQTAFRLAQSRAELGVDARPEATAIWQYSQVILAEAETLHLSNAVEATVSSGAKVKALQQTPPKVSSPGAKPCKFWGTEQGCRQGRACGFLHGPLDDQKNRCWLCSATGHRKAECPVKSSMPPLPAAAGGSDGATFTSTSGSGSKGGGKSGDKKENEKGSGKASKSGGKNGGKKGDGDKSLETPSVAAASTREEVSRDGQQAQNGSGDGKEGGEASTAGFMNEVTSLLKSIRMQGGGGPQLRAFQVMSVGDAREETLLDGGATHCMRQAKSKQEWDQGSPVQVQLASQEVEMRLHPQTNTLLVHHPVQQIVPLAKLIEVGWHVQWGTHGCWVDHKLHGRLPVRLHQGCPVVDKAWGNKLMQSVEDWERSRVAVRAVMLGEKKPATRQEEEVRRLREVFPEVPMSILEKLPGDEEWDPAQLPFNRKKRRQMEKAKVVVLNLFSGQDPGVWKDYERDGVVILHLDLLHGADLAHDRNLAGWIQSMAREGKIDFWLSGPPCRSVSACRHRQDDGPPPLRSRVGPQRFGLDGLSLCHQQQVEEDSIMFLRTLWWFRLAKENKPDVELMLEQPMDPEEWMDPQKIPTGGLPSFMIWPEAVKTFEDLELKLVAVDQGALGHLTRKPTSLATSVRFKNFTV